MKNKGKKIKMIIREKLLLQKKKQKLVKKQKQLFKND